MNKTALGIIVAVIVISIVAGLVWYGAAQQAPAGQPGTATPPNTSSENNSTDRSVITFSDSGFAPSTLTVKAGETITIKNESSSSVQFSSDDHPSHREHPEMNMQVQQPGSETQLTIDEPGTYTYHDHINDRYTGTIVVTN